MDKSDKMGSSRIQGVVSVNFGGCSDINLCMMQDGGQNDIAWVPLGVSNIKNRFCKSRNDRNYSVNTRTIISWITVS